MLSRNFIIILDTAQSVLSVEESVDEKTDCDKFQCLLVITITDMN